MEEDMCTLYNIILYGAPNIDVKFYMATLNPSYFIATVSENTEEQIKEYINSQKEK